MPLRYLVVIAVSLLCLATSVRADGPRKPNVVILLADDMGHADVGFEGCKDIPTPHLDALAKSGVRCTNGYVSGPYCSPTRAGLLTGRYQQRFGHEYNPAGSPREGLPTSETTIADRLKAAGYATGLVGKWHLGAGPEFHPNKRGFDEFYGFKGGAHPYFANQGAPIFRNDKVVEERQYLTDAWGREACSFIDRHKSEPFLLEVAFNAVHTPMDATDARLKRFASIKDDRRRTYAAMLSALDDAVGRIVLKLKDDGLEDDTLIVFFSDNGGPTMRGTTINGSRNDPFRGSKQTTLEGGVHVPFVLSWKGKIAAGTTYEPPIIQLDVLPTALAAAGVAIPASAKLDGVNLLPYLKGDAKGSPHEFLTWRFGPQTAIRRGDWKLVRYNVVADTDVAGPGGPRAKVTEPRLYNLAADPGETNDLASREPARVAELTRAWQAWNAELVPALWGAAPRQ